MHKRAKDRYERNEFKGSKYVQSDLGNVFVLVKQDLLEGKKVLFSGTPCQTAGLAAYIGESLRENLYLLDIVCHGVPSPYIWRDYLNYLKKIEGQQIVAVNFRDKSKYGWKAHIESIEYKDFKKYYKNYTELFYKHVCLRESCGNCPFANTIRPSDITIADFWGWDKTDKEINADDRGVSLVICNTVKGKNLFRQIERKMYVIQTERNLSLQPNLCKPSKLNVNRFEFQEDYVRYGFEYILKKYVKLNLKTKLKLWFINLRQRYL